MNNRKSSFGKRFKELRNEMRLTQKELVKLFNEKYYYNFNTSSISMYENEKQIPEVDVLGKWADLFNVSLDYLLGRTDTKNPSNESDPQENPILKEFEELSEESKKELEKYIKLLKIKDEMDKGKDEQSSTLEKNA